MLFVADLCLFASTPAGSKACNVSKARVREDEFCKFTLYSYPFERPSLSNSRPLILPRPCLPIYTPIRSSADRIGILQGDTLVLALLDLLSLLDSHAEVV